MNDSQDPSGAAAARTTPNPLRPPSAKALAAALTDLRRYLGVDADLRGVALTPWGQQWKLEACTGSSSASVYIKPESKRLGRKGRKARAAETAAFLPKLLNILSPRCLEVIDARRKALAERGEATAVRHIVEQRRPVVEPSDLMRRYQGEMCRRGQALEEAMRALGIAQLRMRAANTAHFGSLYSTEYNQGQRSLFYAAAAKAKAECDAAEGLWLKARERWLNASFVHGDVSRGDYSTAAEFMADVVEGRK